MLLAALCGRRHLREIKVKSLVIGFCRCARCGFDNGKFNWHTYYKCEQCGCRKYIPTGKEEVREQKDNRKGGYDYSDDVLFTDVVSAD